MKQYIDRVSNLEENNIENCYIEDLELYIGDFTTFRLTQCFVAKITILTLPRKVENKVTLPDWIIHCYVGKEVSLKGFTFIGSQPIRPYLWMRETTPGKYYKSYLETGGLSPMFIEKGEV